MVPSVECDSDIILPYKVTKTLLHFKQKRKSKGEEGRGEERQSPWLPTPDQWLFISSGLWITQRAWEEEDSWLLHQEVWLNRSCVAINLCLYLAPCLIHKLKIQGLHKDLLLSLSPYSGCPLRARVMHQIYQGSPRIFLTISIYVTVPKLRYNPTPHHNKL